ncbi:MAG TPA: hypothetical protein PKK48_01535 [Phycisphaerae bacterium]|nr:hypothetical protein [Phycisphaerae bacterium]HPS52448.1 hypothetical protein [Phycisphaerae bacterium]
MAKAAGIFMDVTTRWAEKLQVDMTVLEWAFDNLRHNASNEGCHNFPSRDDVASNDIFFNAVRRMYEIRTGRVLEKSEYPMLRRMILKVHKQGKTPR